MTDGEMVQAAKRRATVRLVDGSVATLVSWGSAKYLHNRAGGGQKVRVQAVGGVARWSVKKCDVAELVEVAV